MDRITRALGKRSEPDSEYQPLHNHNDDLATPLENSTTLEGSTRSTVQEDVPFSWLEYSIFILLGMAMLWAWNMFLAAAPYFASRFQDNPWILKNFQSAILAVSTVSSLVSVILLTNVRYSASYPFRINSALIINIVVFTLLTLSTVWLLDATPNVYFGFTLVMVAATAWATGLLQNGAFAFCASFGRPEYMQSLMTGQGIAGVLPAVAQVVSVLLYPPTVGSSPPTMAVSTEGETSALIYFCTASAVSIITALAFTQLVRRYSKIIESRTDQNISESIASVEEVERASRRNVSLWTLFLKLKWLASGVALLFTETMFFPIFTAKIRSVHEEGGGLLFQPAVFIPVAFFFWNAGDFSGRLLAAFPNPLKSRPFLLFIVTVMRGAWILLYFLCNLNGKGAVVRSDFFFLVVVQLIFGLTNGLLCSNIMMSSGDWVEPGEREAAGSFMGLCLIGGLTCGSLLSFTASGI